MKIVVDIPDYDPNKGIQLKRNAESKLTVIIGYDDFEIGGNPRGLRTLGSCFLSLAQKNVPNGASIRLTEKNEECTQRGFNPSHRKERADERLYRFENP